MTESLSQSLPPVGRRLRPAGLEVRPRLRKKGYVNPPNLVRLVAERQQPRGA